MKPVEWRQSALVVLDQTKLPAAEEYLSLHNYPDVAEAIKRLAVRGAPLIGVVAAFGMALAAHASRAGTAEELLADLEDAKNVLDATRPTAVNLVYATNRIMNAAREIDTVDAVRKTVEKEAVAVLTETEGSDIALSQAGAALIDDGDCVLTICNTGALATGGFGTALGVIRAAYDEGKEISVLACETRPLLQGARLTMWELNRLGIPSRLIVDAAAGHFLRRGEVNKVITGADRIAANGDTANKIGTYTLAVLADRHKIPFYVAAPFTTVDLSTENGERITVEERAACEVTSIAGVDVAPPDAEASNPAFDVTPAGLISAIITDRGISRAPYGESLAGLNERTV